MDNECISLLINFENLCLNIWLILDAHAFIYQKLQAIDVAVLFSKAWASDHFSWLLAQTANTGDNNYAIMLKTGPSKQSLKHGLNTSVLPFFLSLSQVEFRFWNALTAQLIFVDRLTLPVDKNGCNY